MLEAIAFTLIVGGWILAVIYVVSHRSQAYGLDAINRRRTKAKSSANS